MSGASSCHPARLQRFGRSLDALCDGLSRRAGVLDEALAAYRARCEHGFRVPTADTGQMVRALASELRDVGSMAQATTLYDRNNQPAFTIFQERRIERPLSDISPHLVDAVIAIAATLLVLDLRVPAGVPPGHLGDALLDLWPKYLA